MDRRGVGLADKLANAGSMDWTGLFRRGDADVFAVAAQMRSTDADKKWWRSLRHYVRNEDDKMHRPGGTTPDKRRCSGVFFTSNLAASNGNSVVVSRE